MSPDQVADLLGGLAVAAVLATVAAVGLRIARPAWAEVLADFARPATVVLAGSAVAGSLWFSESAHFPPCELCWYTRIAIYPLVPILALRLTDRGPGLRRAAAILAGGGLAVNLWHLAVEIRPSLSEGSCDPVVPCSVRWVEGLGFFTIPRLATVVLVLVLVGLALDPPPPADPDPGADA